MTWRPLPTERDDSPESLAKSLDALSSELGVGTPQVVTAVLTLWEEVVGTTIASHAKPSLLPGNTLVVTVDSPVWATEMRMCAGQVLEALGSRTGVRFSDTLLVRVRSA